MKKLAIISAFMLVATTAATPAMANTTSVVNTGGSANITTTEVNNVDVQVVNTNIADVDQELHAVNNTGGNVSSGNIGMTPCNPCGVTGGSSIVTGDASTANSMDVQANSNVTAVDVATAGGAQNHTDVVNTAGNLGVNTTAVSNTNVGVLNTNIADVDQSAHVVNNTGKNTSTNNIGDSNIVTGHAGTSNAMSADVNENATAINITGDHMQSPIGCDLCGTPCTGTNCTSIVNSGKNLSVNAASVSNTAVHVMNSNVLNSHQGLHAINNTGHNNAANNVYGSNIVTGSAGTDNGMSASGNSNLTAIAIDDSMPMGVNDLLAVNSGANAAINTTAVANTNVGTYNTNLLYAYEAVYGLSSTGYNLAVNNIGAGMTFTGGAGTASFAGVGGNNNATSVGNSATSLLALIALMSL